jgi:hypothetical protein
VRRDGILVQADRAGNPSFNPLLMPDSLKNEYNARQPVDDVKNYFEVLSEVLQKNGYSPDEASAAVLSVLPDILHFDWNKPVAYPNGRRLTDDVFSMRAAWLSHGAATSQGLEPHRDLLAEFPFLGIPNANPKPATLAA